MITSGQVNHWCSNLISHCLRSFLVMMPQTRPPEGVGLVSGEDTGPTGEANGLLMEPTAPRPTAPPRLNSSLIDEAERVAGRLAATGGRPSNALCVWSASDGALPLCRCCKEACICATNDPLGEVGPHCCDLFLVPESARSRAPEPSARTSRCRRPRPRKRRYTRGSDVLCTHATGKWQLARENMTHVNQVGASLVTERTPRTPHRARGS